jgi:PPOX class probable F420-dependent enzyme
MPDGQPQLSVVWANYDGEYVKVNTARGRQKDKNISRNPQVTVMVLDPKNPYRYLEVRGVVEEYTEEGAVDHISELSRIYRGTDYYVGSNASRRDHETRVMAKVRPTSVHANG